MIYAFHPKTADLVYHGAENHGTFNLTLSLDDNATCNFTQQNSTIITINDTDITIPLGSMVVSNFSNAAKI
jgi:hypothetical protein